MGYRGKYVCSRCGKPCRFPEKPRRCGWCRKLHRQAVEYARFRPLCKMERCQDHLSPQVLAEINRRISVYQQRLDSYAAMGLPEESWPSIFEVPV